MIVNILSTRNKILVFIAAFLVLASTIYYFAVFNNTTEIEVHGFYEGYNSAQSLYDDAELVIIGKPTKDFNERDHHVTYYEEGKNPFRSVQDFYTITNIAVEKVVKGEEQNLSTIDIIEPVSLIQQFDGRKKYSISDYSEMKRNSTYVIFLKKNTFGQYSVINMQNGKFNIDNTDNADIQFHDREAIKEKLKFKDDIEKNLLKNHRL